MQGASLKLSKNEQYQTEFANDYLLLREAQRRDCKNLLKLNGVILSDGYIELKLKKYEMTLRDYLNHNRQPDDLNDILSDIILGIKELHELGYVHRDMKHANVMITSALQKQLLQISIEHQDKRQQPQQRFLGHQAKSQSERNGLMALFSGMYGQSELLYQRVIWKVWLTLEQSEAKFEKQSISQVQKHIKQEGVCKEIKKNAEMIIISAPSYPRQTLDDILVPLKRVRFQRYNKDKQIKFV